VTVTGKKAQELREDKERIATELVPVLKKVFINFIKPLEKEPVLVDIELKNWELDPLFRGAYSNTVIGITSLHFNTLLQPVGGKLFFAGEGLSELYYGFLHGAYLTGEEQAKKIIGVIQYQKSLTDSFTMQKIGLNYALRNSIGKPGNGTKY
jgi:polyamine oxidase